MPKTEPITGTIIGIRDCGIIIIVFLSGEDGLTLPVVYDHRLFRHLVECEGCDLEAVVGRTVGYDGDTLTFVE